MPFNWFDMVVVLVLLTGIHIGRKHGMSEELVSLLKWLGIAFGCAFAYEPLGNGISSSSSVFSLFGSYLIAYIGTAMIIAAIFAGLKRAAGGKLLGSDFFGRGEFYLGMVAGAIRFFCILVVGLALLNARAYSSNEVTADLSYQNDVYGSTFFPKLYTVQAQVFERSLIGPFIRQNLGLLLIKPTTPEKIDLRQQQEYASP